MATEIRKVYLVKSDPVKNNNKFWRGTLFDNNDVLCEWGRVGDSGQSKMFSGAGQSFLDKKVREKKTAGRNDEIAYREVDIIDSNVVSTKSVKAVNNSELTSIAKSQIKTSSSEASKLIDYLIKVNAHNITNATGGKITYNYDKGLFQTPLGLVSQVGIDQARNALNGIGDLVAEKKYNESLMELTRDYLMLVPQDIGRQRLELTEFWSDLNKVQSQNAILDGLQASLTQAVSTKKNTTDKDVEIEKPKVFDVKLDIISDNTIIDRITKLYRKTRQSMHSCNHLDVKKVYSIEINTAIDAYAKDGAKMQNIWELWHGTKAANLLSIMKAGLVIPPSSSPHVCGRMYGDGVYASDQSTKALNYAYGYWGNGSRDNNCFMFLLDMAMGNYYVPKGSFGGSKAPHGYDSTFAKAGNSGVYNNEMIVYRTSQVNLKYLIEFSPSGK